MIPHELQNRYAKLAKLMAKDPYDDDARADFRIAELQIRLHILEGKLKKANCDAAEELLRQIDIITHKLECHVNRKKGITRTELYAATMELPCRNIDAGYRGRRYR